MRLGETKASGAEGAVLRDVARRPPVARGLRIGLYGGSFNPAHATHRAVSLLALKRLGLDRVWWLVTPGNPLKDNRGLPPLAERVAFARRLANHPRIDVTGIEAVLGTRYTYETVERLVSQAPGVHFVWLMGADNLAHFHRWQRWRALAQTVPIAVVDRMGESLSATASLAARALGPYRIEESDAAILPLLSPPAWVFLHGLKSPMSSTGIRARMAGGAGGVKGAAG
ncbi:nicotinate-nucleotide adenylyltransferase [Aquabacter cavernae]|uniref:nicotinate-nucleotide adenylyltransferase n=1 Tax=Aquabacter cavernae TaxID=2496029 RepID=UPI000F8E9CA4|nr:nicotinate-nucleotide adenylyltransferase [Aquabacter cavernae]